MKNKRRNRERLRLLILAVLCVVLMLSSVLLKIRTDTDDAMNAAQVRAGAAARQVASQFRQAVEDAYRQLQVGSVAITKNDNAIDDMLRSLYENGSFSGVAVLKDGMLRMHDGQLIPAEAEPVFIPYVQGGMSGKLVAGANGVIHLHLSIDENTELVGWMDEKYVDALMNGAFPEEYGRALYNAATGAYLINNTTSDETRYYDTLMSINEGGCASRLMYHQETQAYIPGVTGEGYYIAQCPTGIATWSVSLFLSEDILMDVSMQDNTLDRIGLILLVLSVIFAILFVLQLTAVFRKKRSLRTTEEKISAEIMSCMIEDARMDYFIYSRKRERIERYLNGMQFAQQELKLPASAAAFAKLYGLVETDSSRFSDRLHDLRKDESADLRMKSAIADEERMLRFEMKAIASDDDLILCSIRDWTLESEREDVERMEKDFRRSMIRKASSVWEIDASKNRWRLVSGEMPSMLKKLGVNQSGWHNYTADLNGPMRDFMDAGDYDRYAGIMSPSGLGELLASGKPEHTMECRVKSNEASAYRWYRLVVHVFRSSEGGRLMADLFVFNVDAAKNADLERQERARILQKALTAIGGVYYGIYYVELEKDVCYTAKAEGGSAARLSRSFKETIDEYIAQDVHPEDQAALRSKLSSYQLSRTLTEENHLRRYEYRRKRGEQYENAAVIVQAARFENGSVKDVVIAMRKYDGCNKVL